MQPRQHGKRGDAGQAADDIRHIAGKRRLRGHLAAHALGDGDKERDHRQENHRQQQRALDDDDRLLGATGKIDAAGGRRRRHFEPEQEDADDQREQNQREKAEPAPCGAGTQATESDSEETAEQDEVREERQQPYVRRHPADERNFKEEHEERGERRPGQAEDCMIIAKPRDVGAALSDRRAGVGPREPLKKEKTTCVHRLRSRFSPLRRQS